MKAGDLSFSEDLQLRKSQLRAALTKGTSCAMWIFGSLSLTVQDFQRFKEPHLLQQLRKAQRRKEAWRLDVQQLPRGYSATVSAA